MSRLQKRQECTGSECTRVWRGATVWDGRTRGLIKKQRGAKGMAEWLKILGLRNLSLIPGTHMVKQETQLHGLSSDVHMCAVMCARMQVNENK